MTSPARIESLALEARRIIMEHAHETPLDRSATISRLTGSRVYLKLESLQKTGSFKARGALYKVYLLKKRGYRGVVAASAGNHSQGVAYAARAHGVEAIIVMPENAPPAKVNATLGYGAKVVLHGEVVDEALRMAESISKEKGYPLVHPFNDEEVIAGNATIGLEVLEQLGDLDAIIVPIGGGGLISGVAAVLKQRRPGVKVIGVEPRAAPKMLESLKAGRPVSVGVAFSLADGLVVKKPGDLTFKLVSELVDDIVVVDEDEIARAMYLLLERGKVLAEGAGAASVAALLQGVKGLEGKRVVALISGGNVDLTSLEKVILKGLVREGSLARITGFIPDRPGELRRILDIIARHKCNVVDVIHDRTDPAIPPWHAKVSIVMEAPSREALEKVMAELEEAGYRFKRW